MPLTKADIVRVEGVFLVSTTTVGGALYGFAFAIYIFCARSLYLQLEDRDRRRQHLFTLLYMSCVMALALCNVAVGTRDMQASFVDHADYPGGGLNYTNEVFGRSPTGIFGDAVVALLDLMSYGIQIWRLWVVWSASQYSLFVVVLPVLSLLANLGFGVADTVINALGSKLTRRLVLLLLYGQISAQFCISITVTALIIARILVVRRRNVKLMGKTDNANPYTSVISMLVESFALEFVWIVVELISLAPYGSVTLSIYFFSSVTQQLIQLLAYLFVIYRVTTGKGWKEDTAEKLTTLQWNRDDLQTTQFGTRASIPTTHEEA